MIRAARGLGALPVAGRERKNASFDEHAVLCRFEADGDIDLGFGDPATPGCRAYARGGWNALARAANGDILAAGSERLDGDGRAIVTRMDADGLLLPTFGTDGRAVRGTDGYFSDVAKGNDGRLIAVGVVDGFSGTPRGIFSAFTDDGEADFDFADSAGTVMFSTGTNRVCFGQAVEVAVDGSYVISSAVEVSEGGLRPYLFRLWPDGTAYPGFAPFGFRIYDPCDGPCGFRGEDLSVHADGRITLAGTFNPDNSDGGTDMYAMRLAANGSPDTEFGDRDPLRPGMTVIPFDLVDGESSDAAQSVALQGERVVVGGYVTSTKGDDDYDFAVVRLADGPALLSDGFE